MPKIHNLHWWGIAAGALYIISVIWAVGSIQHDQVDSARQPTMLAVGAAAFAFGLGLHVAWYIEVNHERRRRSWRK